MNQRVLFPCSEDNSAQHDVLKNFILSCIAGFGFNNAEMPRWTKRKVSMAFFSDGYSNDDQPKRILSASFCVHGSPNKLYGQVLPWCGREEIKVRFHYLGKSKVVLFKSKSGLGDFSKLFERVAVHVF